MTIMQPSIQIIIGYKLFNELILLATDKMGLQQSLALISHRVVEVFIQ